MTKACKTNTTKFFVVMSRGNSGMLRCVGREGGPTAGAWTAYGFKSRAWAEKFAAKREGRAVYSVQGQSYMLSHATQHYALALDAERQFNPRGE